MSLGVQMSPRAASVAALGVALALIAGLLAARQALVPEPLERLQYQQRDRRGAIEHSWEGSWHFPRGGPYILGFESTTRAALFIDGRRVVAGSGQRVTRRVYEPGVYAVRFEVSAPATADPPAAVATGARSERAAAPDSGSEPANAAPPDPAAATETHISQSTARALGEDSSARLLWHPPGRRGPPEYVPPSSLSAEAPDSAVFGPWVGASPRDGLFAALIALCIAALIGFWSRAAIRRADTRVLVGVGAIALLGLLLRLWGLNDAGQTWDEDVNWAAGRNYITNLLALDFRQASWLWNYEHPPVMKYIAGLGAQWSDGYGPARALSALLMALGCALLVPIGARLCSLQVGVIAALIATLSPHLVAHGKVVGHEAPTVLLWAAAIWLALRAHDPAGAKASDNADADAEADADAASPGQPGGDAGETGQAADGLPLRLAVLAVIIGLAVFARFVNALLAPLVAAILLIEAPPGQRKRTLWLGVAVMVPVVIAVGFAIWPRLWETPIEHLQEAWAKLRRPHGAEPFLGQLTNRPPRYYFAVYLIATAPLAVVISAAAGLARALWGGRARARTTATLLLWLAIPMVVSLSPVRQDGVRYIMPCLLALAMLAAIGLDGALRVLCGALRTRGRPGLARACAPSLTAAFSVYLAIACARVHPYYLDYYGEQVGGPAAVAERRWFEIAWWGEGIADAIDYVNEHAAPGARVHKRCVAPSHLTWLRADLWAREAHDPARADWIIVYQPSTGTCPLPPRAALVHRVEVQGAALVDVYYLGRDADDARGADDARE